MKKIAIATRNSEITDFRSCTAFTFLNMNENGKVQDELEERAKSCAGIIDKVFQLIDAKVDKLYVKDILEEDKIVLENVNIEVIITDSFSKI